MQPAALTYTSADHLSNIAIAVKHCKMDFDQVIKQLNMLKFIERDEYDSLQESINAGLNVNFVNYNDNCNTPLHVAVANCKLEAIELLLKNGAKSEAKNGDFKTPIDLCPDDEEKKQAIEAIFQQMGKCANQTLDSQQTDDLPTKTFLKRPGTDNQGIPYETKMPTLVLFRVLHDDRIKSFDLGNNVAGIGALDDIVLRTNLGGKTRLQFVQLKHKSPEHTVNFENLIKLKNKNNDFDIFKYFDSYMKIRQKFSTASTDVMFQGKFENMDIDLIIYTPARFEFPEEARTKTTDSYDVFFTTCFGKTVQVEFTEPILNYIKEETKKVHKHAVAKKIANLIITQNGNLETMNLKPSKECVLEMLKTNAVSLSELFQTDNQPAVKDFKNLYDKVYGCLNNIELEFDVSGIEIFVEDFLRRLKFYTQQATENLLEEIIRKEMKIKGYECDDVLFLKSHRSVEDWCSEKGQVQYLTKNCRFFEEVAANDKLERIHLINSNKINCNDVVFRRDETSQNSMFWDNLKTIKHENQFCINIYSATPKLCCVNIFQYFGVAAKVIIIDNTNSADLIKLFAKALPQCLIIAWITEGNSGSLVRKILNNVKRLIFITDESCAGEWSSIADETVTLSDFEKGSKEKLLERTITFQGSKTTLGTLLGDAPEKIIPENTLQKLLINENIEISKANFSMKYEEKRECLIDRKLTDKISQSESSVSEIDDRIVVVAGKCGVGKTTLLEARAQSMKTVDPSTWIIVISLLQFSKYFSKLKEDKKKLTKTDAMHFLQMMANFENELQSDKLGSFEENLFRWKCDNGKVILLFDEFAEVFPDYESVVLQLLKIFQTEFTFPMWVTTRFGEPLQKLEDALDVCAFTLNPFTESESELFLKHLWSRMLQIPAGKESSLEAYIILLLSHLIQALGPEGRELFSVPQVLIFISKYFLNHCKGHCNSNGNNTNFDKVNMASFCKELFKKQNMVLLEKTCKLNLYMPVIKQLGITHLQQMKKQKKQAAMYTLLTSSQLQMIMSKRKIKTIERFMLKGIPKFEFKFHASLHGAQFIYDKMCSLNIPDFKQFIQHVFINCLIANDHVQIAQFLKDIAQNMSCPLPKFKVYLILELILDNLPVSWEAFHKKTVPLLLGIVEYHLGRLQKSPNKFDNIVHGKTAHIRSLLLSLASKMGYFRLVQLISYESVDIGWLQGWTVLHFAVLGGCVNTVKHIVSKMSNVNVKTVVEGTTPLLLAALNKSFKIAAILLHAGADIDCANLKSETPLHVAASSGNLCMVKYLLFKGANMDAKNADHKTPPELCSKNSKVDAVFSKHEKKEKNSTSM